MPKKCFGRGDRALDARPDRADYRDLPYRAPLVSLPACFPECDFMVSDYAKHVMKHKLVLDQDEYGACTGFGLAAVIHRVIWGYDRSAAAEAGRVSTAMLYHMARIYDEWQGEDYEGSSCRGAMKGWHHHGVCRERFWKYEPPVFKEPDEGWNVDAAERPLGAYYRVNRDSIADLQSALREVGAVYASANVHDGWDDPHKQDKLTAIEVKSGETGGHAFAIVGYTPEGFVVQNSWGTDWGCEGFAIVCYEDWVKNGVDAWVAVMGAPVSIQPAMNRVRSTRSLRVLAAEEASRTRRSGASSGAAVGPPLFSEAAAYDHTVVLGNEGRPLNRFLHLESGVRAVEEAAEKLPRAWLSNQPVPRLAVYAHGGLNSEEASIKRIRAMAPYFEDNGIYPLFATWRTGPFESIRWMLEDAITEFISPARARLRPGWFAEQIQEARDRVLESICRRLLVRSVWSQMKQNARASVGDGGGIRLIAKHLAALKDSIPELEVHLIGHSAGAILLGHLLESLTGGNLHISTCTLYAPACTVAFANEWYVGAVNRGILLKDDIHIDVLSDERERADTAGPYGKSLLYLVSRALEDVHKMPILGMQAASEDVPGLEDVWNEQCAGDVKSWKKFTGRKVPGRTHIETHVRDGVEMIPLAHGSFDNNVEVVTDTLVRIRGDVALDVEVTNLHGF